MGEKYFAPPAAGVAQSQVLGHGWRKAGYQPATRSGAKPGTSRPRGVAQSRVPAGHEGWRKAGYQPDTRGSSSRMYFHFSKSFCKNHFSDFPTKGSFSFSQYSTSIFSGSRRERLIKSHPLCVYLQKSGSTVYQYIQIVSTSHLMKRH